MSRALSARSMTSGLMLGGLVSLTGCVTSKERENRPSLENPPSITRVETDISKNTINASSDKVATFLFGPQRESVTAALALAQSTLISCMMSELQEPGVLSKLSEERLDVVQRRFNESTVRVKLTIEGGVQSGAVNAEQAKVLGGVVSEIEKFTALLGKERLHPEESNQGISTRLALVGRGLHEEIHTAAVGLGLVDSRLAVSASAIYEGVAASRKEGQHPGRDRFDRVFGITIRDLPESIPVAAVSSPTSITKESSAADVMRQRQENIQRAQSAMRGKASLPVPVARATRSGSVPQAETRQEGSPLYEVVKVGAKAYETTKLIAGTSAVIATVSEAAATDGMVTAVTEAAVDGGLLETLLEWGLIVFGL